MNQPGRRESEPVARPTLVLAVYSWDMLLGILAVFGALAALGGQVAVGARTVSIPLPLQVLDAFSSAAYAAMLIMVASLLTRPLAWIRGLQISVLGAAVGLAGLSLLTAGVTGGLGTVALLVSLLFVLVDVLAIVVMTERRIVDWYVQPGATPRYVVATFAFWVTTSVAAVLLNTYA